MRDDSLNYFFPFEANSAGENQLTRAFLVLFRYVPAVQVLFYDLVRESLENDKKMAPQADAISFPPSYTALSEPPVVLTQKGSFPATEGTICSVVITDSAWKAHGEVSFADRSAIYDGVIAAGGWTYVIEVKPSSGNIWEGQLNPSILGIADPDAFKLLPVPAVIEWSEIVQRLTSLAATGVLHGAEKTLVDDFRQFVFRKYPSLNPYPTLRSCHRNTYLLNRRCEDILDSVASDAGLNRSEGNWIDLPTEVARRAYLWSEVPAASDEGGDIVLGIWAADNKTHAEKFRARTTADRLQELGAEGWQISPNLIFRHIQRRISDNPVEGRWQDYFQFWKPGEQRIGRYDASAASALLDRLMAAKLLTPDGRSELESKIGQQVDVTPGMHLQFRWPFAEAARSDDNREFKSQVRKKLVDVLAVWGQQHVLMPQPSKQEQGTLATPVLPTSATDS